MAFEMDCSSHHPRHSMVVRKINSDNQDRSIKVLRIEDRPLRFCVRDRDYDFDGDANRHHRSGTTAKASVGG